MRDWTLKLSETGNYEITDDLGTRLGELRYFYHDVRPLDIEKLTRACRCHDDLLAALAVMTLWADRLGSIAVNCGAVDRTVALDGDLAVAKAAIAKAGEAR